MPEVKSTLAGRKARLKTGQARASRAKRPTSYHHGSLRDTLIEQGLVLVEQQGSAKLTVRAIATSAGVSHAACAHHFEGKEQLLAAIAARGFELLSESGSAVPRGARTARSRIEAIVNNFVSFAIGRPELFNLMFGDFAFERSKYPEFRVSASASFGSLAGPIKDYIREKSGSEAEAPDDDVIVFWGSMYGLATQLIGRKESRSFSKSAHIQRVVDRFCEILLEGIVALRK